MNRLALLPILLLAFSGAAFGQRYVPLPELEERHGRALQAHADVEVKIARLEGELRGLAKQLAPLEAKIRKLRQGPQGLLERDRLQQRKLEQSKLTAQVVHARIAVRGLRETDEPVARLRLILARMDLIRRLLRKATQNTRRDPGYLKAPLPLPDRQGTAALDRAERLRAQLAQLKRLAPPTSAQALGGLDSLSMNELEQLPAALGELRDAAQERSVELERLVRSRRALVAELERMQARFPRLAQGLLSERRALARTLSLQSALKTRAKDYDKEIGRVHAETVIRELRRLRGTLRRLVRVRTGFGSG